ncbi:hypothetical protein MPS01_22210 [Marinilactibacillus psychrotolerans]|nr:hypothetical protein MPS01_22210 [Marinilactibacillus psychrotolerans]
MHNITCFLNELLYKYVIKRNKCKEKTKGNRLYFVLTYLFGSSKMINIIICLDATKKIDSFN